MTNKDWVLLIAHEFNVSNTVAKCMLHEMLKYYNIIKDLKKYANN